MFGGLARALRERLQSTGYMMSAADGPAGKAGVVRFLAQNRRRHNDGSLVRVRMKALDGGSIAVRPRTSDMYNAASYYAYGLHLPPPEIRDLDLRLICELGSNIGAALAALAARYPSARLVGVEPDAANLKLAKLNLEPFGDRIGLVQAGIWDHEATLIAEDAHGAGEHGLTVRELEADESSRAGGIPAISIDTLLEREAPGEEVDYMHVTIEGAESRVFAAGGDWPARVRSLRVELHPYFDYRAEQCVPQLEALGYRAWPAPEEPGKWIYAVRG